VVQSAVVAILFVRQQEPHEFSDMAFDVVSAPLSFWNPKSSGHEGDESGPLLRSQGSATGRTPPPGRE
jgi:hypothetical protein